MREKSYQLVQRRRFLLWSIWMWGIIFILSAVCTLALTTVFSFVLSSKTFFLISLWVVFLLLLGEVSFLAFFRVYLYRELEWILEVTFALLLFFIGFLGQQLLPDLTGPFPILSMIFLGLGVFIYLACRLLYRYIWQHTRFM